MAYKAIFLDRDDTLIEDPGYISEPEQVKLLDGTAEALIELRAMGYKLVVVSNQSAVARGLVTEKKLAAIHNRLESLLAAKGAGLDKIYYCPYHPQGTIEKYRKESNSRKPNPGMFLEAAKEIGIDFSQSWTVGDSVRDIQAGKEVGTKTILIDDPSHTKLLKFEDTQPDFKAVNIKEAVNIIKQSHRKPHQPISEIQAEPKRQVQPNEPTVVTETENMEEEKTDQSQTTNQADQLLGDILEQLKRNGRGNMFDEFSLTRLMAGVFQVLAPFCLLICIWLLTSATKRYNAVFTSIGFAVVFQMMALTFYIMHQKK